MRSSVIGLSRVGTVTRAFVAPPGNGPRSPDLTSMAGSPGVAPPSAGRRRYHRWVVPGSLTALYLLFTVAVHLRRLDDLDLAAFRVARPGGVWGPAQMRATHVVSALQPTHLAGALLLVVAVLSLLRRSLRPMAVMAVVVLPVVAVTLGTKRAMSHWDPSTTPVAHTSFPSGHAVAAITGVGLVVLLLRPHTRWGWLLPAATGCVMGCALVVASVHPATDVIGAGLLAAAALTSATAATLGPWASDSRRRNVR